MWQFQLSSCNLARSWYLSFQEKTSVIPWDWLNLWTFQLRFLPVANCNFWTWWWTTYLQMSLALPLLQWVNLIMCLWKSTSLWLFSGSCLNAGKSGRSRAYWQGLQATISLQDWSSISMAPDITVTQPRNSSTETCSLLSKDSSHLILNYPTLLHTHGTLNPVVKQLLWNNLPSFPGRQILLKAISVHSKHLCNLKNELSNLSLSSKTWWHLVFTWQHSQLHSWEGWMPQFCVCFQILRPQPIILRINPTLAYPTAAGLCVFCTWESGEVSLNPLLWLCN